MKPLLYLSCFIILMQISNGMIINEIMADTIADESLNEWVELYNDQNVSVNVSNWIIGDDSDNDTIEGGLYNKEGTIIEAFGYAIITDESTRVYNNFNVSSDAVSLYIDDSSIGGYGLSNNGETIYLYDNDENLIDEKIYNATTEDLSWTFVNTTLFKSNPTPGFANDESIITEQGCDYAVDFIIAKTIFDNSSDFSFKIRTSKISGSSTNFTSRAKIEDLNGKLIKEYKPFTNQSITKQRTSTTYTPNLEEEKSYFMDSNITVQCNDTNIENNFDNRIITIKGELLQEESSIDIAKVYDLGSDKKAKFGQTIRLKLNAYKGNTNKKSIAIWIEDKKGNRLSKQSKTNLELKYTNYSLTLPVQIKPNCDEEFDDDDYIIIARGLDSEDEEEVEIEDLTDSMCDVKIVQTKHFSPKKFSFDIQDFNENIKVDKKFNTKIVLDNNNDQDIPIKLWSYVYRGPKSYSGEREENKKEFILKSNSLQVVELSNIVDKAEPGNYKFKVIVNKNNQKTNNEITKDIIINNKLKSNNIENLNNNENNNAENLITANNVLMNRGIIYESSTEKAKALIPLFLIIISIMINIVLIWRR
ncbi:MAG: lamin tail domain-containing protein [Candidatus Woesearchaeota archaeon]|nr:lamin tail domain-containing protein [Candidatus Woesearchaeota archaeon]